MNSRIKLVLLVIATFFISGISAFAQQNKIVKIRAKLFNSLKEDTSRVNLLTELSHLYHQIKPDSTIFFATEAYELSKKLGFKRGMADALNYWAIGAYVQSYQGDAIKKFRESLNLYREMGDMRGEGAVLNNIAMVFNNQGDYKNALIYYELSLKKRIVLKDSAGLAASYNNIGNSYTDLGKYSIGLEYLFEGLKIREKFDDTSALANSYTNIGSVYFLLEKYDLAFKYNEIAYKWYNLLGNNNGVFQCLITFGAISSAKKEYQAVLSFYGRALNVALEMNSRGLATVAYINMGRAFVDLGLYDKAIENYEESFQFLKASNDMEGIALSNIGLGRAYLKKKEVGVALTHLLSGYNEAVMLGKILRIHEATLLLAEAYELQKDFDKANKFLHESIKLRDSLINEESSKKVYEVEYNYALEKKQKEIELLEKDKSIQEGVNERQTLVVVFLIVFVLMMMLALLYINRIRNKERKLKEKTLLQKQEIEIQSLKLRELNILKDKTFSILSHDLRSPISALIGVMDLMNQKLITTEDFNALKGNLTQQLKSLGLLLDNLLNWSKSHMQGQSEAVVTEIHLATAVTKNIALLTELASQKSIFLSSTVPSNLMICADKDHIDIIFRNLLANAIKFSNANSKVVVDAQQNNDQVTITVTDSGVGMKPETLASLFGDNVKVGYGTNGEKGTGLGLLLCKEFTERNNGTIRVSSELGKGTTFYVTLPTRCD